MTLVSYESMPTMVPAAVEGRKTKAFYFLDSQILNKIYPGLQRFSVLFLGRERKPLATVVS